MTGFALMYGPCLGCRNTFAYNPNKVPSFSVTGTREPVCQKCLDLINSKRTRLGLPEFVPHPDAYSPCPEGELS